MFLIPKSRRALTGGFAAAATVALAASTAYGCGVWRGQFSVQDASGGITSGVGANGAAPLIGTSGMKFCGGDINGPYTETNGGARINGDQTGVSTFKVLAQPATSCPNLAGVNQLPGGKYTINFLSWEMMRQPGGTTSSLGYTGFADCMNLGEGGGTTGFGIPLDVIDVNSTGHSIGDGGVAGAWKTIRIAGVLGDRQNVTGAQVDDRSAICISGAGPGTVTNNMQVWMTFI